MTTKFLMPPVIAKLNHLSENKEEQSALLGELCFTEVGGRTDGERLFP